MRIAIIGCRGLPAADGGVERVVEQITRELSTRGHEVLIYSRKSYVGDSPQPQFGTRIITGGLDGKHLDTITHTATAMFNAVRNGVDVIHLHNPGPAMLSWMADWAAKPIVLTLHAPDWKRDKWSTAARTFLRFGLRAGMKRADAVTSVSSSLAEELAGEFEREVAYIPNAPEPAEYIEPSEIGKWHLEPEKFALWVGRFEPEKRLDLLLKAWDKAQPTVPLVVVGDFQKNAYGIDCRAVACENVLFVGPQYGKVLAELYSNAAVVIQPSVLEGMSMVLLEAAAHGRCVIASDIPANKDVMGDACLYFAADSLNELAGQISRCLEQESLRKQLGQEARQTVQAKYSWPAVAREYEKMYLAVKEGKL